MKNSYDILADSNGLFWESMKVGQKELPKAVLKTGSEDDGGSLYTVKGEVYGKVCIGKYNGYDKAYFALDGGEEEVLSGAIDILCFQESKMVKTVSIEEKYVLIFLKILVGVN